MIANILETVPIIDQRNQMPELLHEYWENENGGEFCSVRASSDRHRPLLMPDARLVFSVRASSWYQAMQLHNERLDYGDYMPLEGVPDHFYTDEEAAEQQAYLEIRAID